MSEKNSGLDTMNIKIRKIKIETKNGVIKTPFFMPDATRGFVKFLSNTDLKSANISPMVVNTYHLYLQPGIDSIKKAGGIHKFMNWDGPLLSDSGGYQVFSLIHKNPKMGKIDDSKVIFRSPLDGSRHEITPEKSIQIQFDLGVDMMVCLDDPPPNHYSRQKIEKAVERTIAWAKRCLTSYSLYHDILESYFRTEVSEDWADMRQEAMRILQQEAELKEIARLVGVDALSNRDRLILGTAKAIREDFLHQNAFDDVDTYTSFAKQHRMLRNIMTMNRHAREAVEQGVPAESIMALPVQEEISRSRYIPEADMDELDAIAGRIETQVRGLAEERAVVNEPAQ